MISCYIPGCLETDPEDYTKCIRCDSQSSLPFLSRFEGICVPDCTQLDGNYENDIDNLVCRCQNDHYTTDDFACIVCPFPNCD